MRNESHTFVYFIWLSFLSRVKLYIIKCKCGFGTGLWRCISRTGIACHIYVLMEQFAIKWVIVLSILKCIFSCFSRCFLVTLCDDWDWWRGNGECVPVPPPPSSGFVKLKTAITAGQMWRRFNISTIYQNVCYWIDSPHSLVFTACVAYNPFPHSARLYLSGLVWYHFDSSFVQVSNHSLANENWQMHLIIFEIIGRRKMSHHQSRNITLPLPYPIRIFAAPSPICRQSS